MKVILIFVSLLYASSASPSTGHSCAPFFYQKVTNVRSKRSYSSIVRFQCDKSPPFDGTCDPTFVERIYHRAVSGYSCLVEYLSRPTPLLAEPACADRDGYDRYFKALGMSSTSAGWVLQDPKAGVLLQVRPNIPYREALDPCFKEFESLSYKYVGSKNGHAWEGSNSTHHIWYSLISQDFRRSACVLSADSRRFDNEKSLETEGTPPGDNVAGPTCTGGTVNVNGECKKPNAPK